MKRNHHHLASGVAGQHNISGTYSFSPSLNTIPINERHMGMRKGSQKPTGPGQGRIETPTAQTPATGQEPPPSLEGLKIG
jgi:hypothetical protein